MPICLSGASKYWAASARYRSRFDFRGACLHGVQAGMWPSVSSNEAASQGVFVTQARFF